MKLSLSPSSASRWLSCTASPAFIAKNHDKLPKDSSSYSIEGGKAHTAAAAGLLLGMEAMVDACEGDLEMVAHVKGYMDFVESKKRPGDDHMVESKVPLWYMKDRHGYIDSAIVGPKRMYITDLKYGEGVAVFARGNPQLAIYCQCVVSWLDDIYGFPDHYLITIAVYQPRARGAKRDQDGPFSTWSITVEELRVFVERIAKTAYGIISGKYYEFAPSDDNCQFCRGVTLCTARAKQLLDAPDEILPASPKPLEQIYLDDPARLKPATIAFLIKNKSAICGWLEKVCKYGYAALKEGKPELLDNAWKLVPGKEGNRAYKDAKSAKKFLLEHLPKDTVLPPASVISPKQAEDALAKLYGKDIAAALIADFVTRPPGGDTLAPIDDPRPSSTEDHGFENLDHDLL